MPKQTNDTKGHVPRTRSENVCVSSSELSNHQLKQIKNKSKEATEPLTWPEVRGQVRE